MTPDSAVFFMYLFWIQRTILEFDKWINWFSRMDACHSHRTDVKRKNVFFTLMSWKSLKTRPIWVPTTICKIYLLQQHWMMARDRWEYKASNASHLTFCHFWCSVLLKCYYTLLLPFLSWDCQWKLVAVAVRTALVRWLRCVVLRGSNWMASLEWRRQRSLTWPTEVQLNGWNVESVVLLTRIRPTLMLAQRWMGKPVFWKGPSAPKQQVVY